MSRLGSIVLVLSLVGPSFAADDAAEALADSSGKPGLPVAPFWELPYGCPSSRQPLRPSGLAIDLSPATRLA